jgi:hypothetical protein
MGYLGSDAGSWDHPVLERMSTTGETSYPEGSRVARVLTEPRRAPVSCPSWKGGPCLTVAPAAATAKVK